MRSVSGKRMVQRSPSGSNARVRGRLDLVGECLHEKLGSEPCLADFVRPAAFHLVPAEGQGPARVVCHQGPLDLQTAGGVTENPVFDGVDREFMDRQSEHLSRARLEIDRRPGQAAPGRLLRRRKWFSSSLRVLRSSMFPRRSAAVCARMTASSRSSRCAT